MKFNLLWVALFFAGNLTVTANFDCEGTISCEDDNFISCSLETPDDGRCDIEYGETFVKCITKDAEGHVLKTEIKKCPTESGSGGICDPSDPLWWVFCDPFAY